MSNPWTEGLKIIINNNPIAVSVNKDAWKDRKRSVAKFIIQTVCDGRINNGLIIGKEALDPSRSCWCDTVYELDINYYH